MGYMDSMDFMVDMDYMAYLGRLVKTADYMDYTGYMDYMVYMDYMGRLVKTTDYMDYMDYMAYMDYMGYLGRLVKTTDLMEQQIPMATINNPITAKQKQNFGTETMGGGRRDKAASYDTDLVYKRNKTMIVSG